MPGLTVLVAAVGVTTGIFDEQVEQLHTSTYIASQYYSLGLLLFAAAVPWFLYGFALTGGQLRWWLLSPYGRLIAAVEYLVPKAVVVLFVIACVVLDWMTCLVLLVAAGMLTFWLFCLIGFLTDRGALIIRELVPGFHVLAVAATLYLSVTLLLDLSDFLPIDFAYLVAALVVGALISYVYRPRGAGPILFGTTKAPDEIDDQDD